MHLDKGAIARHCVRLPTARSCFGDSGQPRSGRIATGCCWRSTGRAIRLAQQEQLIEMQRSSHPELSTSIETVGPTDPGSSIPFWMRRTIRTLAQLAALLVACLLVLMAFARAGHELLNPWLFASLFAPLAVAEILRQVISAPRRD